MAPTAAPLAEPTTGLLSNGDLSYFTAKGPRLEGPPRPCLGPSAENPRSGHMQVPGTDKSSEDVGLGSIRPASAQEKAHGSRHSDAKSLLGEDTGTQALGMLAADRATPGVWGRGAHGDS
ncbi:hypothetical protein H8959_019666 [Pygathrix nigripes]